MTKTAKLCINCKQEIVSEPGRDISRRYKYCISCRTSITRFQAAALSKNQTAVLKMAASGLSNRQIGRELNITEQTVKNQISISLLKLCVPDRTSAVVRALKLGILRLEEIDSILVDRSL